MSEKRMWDGDGERQPGDYDAGYRSDASNATQGSNFSGAMLSGRKVATPRGMKGKAPVPPRAKPRFNPNATPQQSQPVIGGQNLGFTFGSGAAPPGSSMNSGFQQQAPQQQGFGFGNQQQAPQQGFGFGDQQQIPQQQAPQQGFNFNFGSGTPTGLPAMPQTEKGANPPDGFGYRGSLFNIPAKRDGVPPGSSEAQKNTEVPSLSDMFGSKQAKEVVADQPNAGFRTGWNMHNQGSTAPVQFNYLTDVNKDNAMTDIPAPATNSFFGNNAQQNTFAPAPQPSSTSAPASVFSQTQSPGLTSGFKFGEPAKQEQSAATSGFTFGQQPQQQQPVATPSFTFGQSAQQQQQQQPAATTSFTFGQSAQQQQSATTPSFIFGQPAQQAKQQPTATTPSFTFGQSAQQQQQPAATTSFTFGQSTQETAPPASTITPTEQKPNMFAFGKAQPSAPTPAVSMFGNTTSTTAPAPSVFNQVTAGAAAGQGGNMFAQGSSSPTKSVFPTASAPKAPESAPATEDKKLPAFSFGNSTSSTTAKMPETSEAQSSAIPIPSLFSSSTTAAEKQANTTAPSIFSKPPESTPAQPKFSFTQPTNVAASPGKPMFSNTSADTASISESSLKTKSSAASATTTKTPTFSFSNNAAEGTVLKSTTENQSDQQNSSVAPSPISTKPLFSFKPTTQFDSPQPAATPATTFKPAVPQQQDISPNKSPFTFKPVTQKRPLDDASNDPPAEESPSVAKKSKTNASVRQEEPNKVELSKPPQYADFPSDFTSQWRMLHTGDLTTDEAVEILFCDWLQQIEIPERPKVGMNVDQRDELNWLWQHHTVDAAWEHHVKELGNQDRNLLEVYRIVLKLKDRVDRLFGKVWNKNTALSKSKIFDERHIRKMAKRNVEIWESGLRSEIKNLKKRKAGSDDEAAEETRETAKRNRNETATETRPRKFAPAPEGKKAEAKVTAEPSHLGKRKSDDEADAQQSPGSAKRSKTKATPDTQTAQFAPFAESDGSEEEEVSQQKPAETPKSVSASSTQQETKAADSISYPDITQPAKSIFSSPSTTNSAQKSKTSQLFASIASKPIDPPAPVEATPAPKRSLFDRIARDSTGAPVKDFTTPSPSSFFSTPEVKTADPAADQHHDEEEDENEGDEDQNEEDADENEGDEDEIEEEMPEDDEDKSFVPGSESGSTGSEEPATNTNGSNIFTQSAGALSKETAAGDNTWNPDSPIRFGKETGSTAKPVMGFVPKGGMPKVPTKDPRIKVSSTSSWTAPANPFGNFAKKSDEESKNNSIDEVSTPKSPPNLDDVPVQTGPSGNTSTTSSNLFGNFSKKANQDEVTSNIKETSAQGLSMPKPPATSDNTPAAVSSLNNFKAPSSPFGNFKTSAAKTDEKVLAPPEVTISAPSPQRPISSSPASSLFGSPALAPKIEPGKSLFGSTSTSTNIFGSTTPADSAFGATSAAPSFVIDSQPAKSIFSNTAQPATTPGKSLFGATSASPNIFGNIPAKSIFDTKQAALPAAATSNAWTDFTKGLHKPASPAPSGISVFASQNTSLNPSRATSPAMSAYSTQAEATDAEAHPTTVEDEDSQPPEAQLDLSTANAGEEGEVLLFTVKAKAQEYAFNAITNTKDWTVRGVGELRVLLNKESRAVRVVLRQEHSAKILLNAGLLAAADYSLMGPKRVNFMVAKKDGLSRWVLQVGKEEAAERLSAILQERKGH